MMANLPLLWLSTAFLTGLLLGRSCALPVWVWLGLMGVCFIFGLCETRILPYGFTQRRRGLSPLPIGILLAVLLAGAGRYQSALPHGTADEVQWYNGKGKVQLIGIITAAPEQGKSTTLLRLSAEKITWNGQTMDVKGSVQVWLRLGADWHYGERVELLGSLEYPPQSADFSYRDYLQQQGVYSLAAYPYLRLVEVGQGNPLFSAVYAFRQRCYEVINRILPQPEAALLNGILLGLERDLPEQIQNAFRDTGTAHIIAISGFNIALVAGMVVWVFSRLAPRFWIPPITALVIAAYTLLVGGGASVVRAAIMGTFCLLGQQLGRRQTGLNTLAFTAAWMSVFTPTLPWDVSFQLSFAATLGLVLFADRLQMGFIHLAKKRIPLGLAQRLAKPVGEYFLFTLAAQAVTLPVIAVHFGRVSLSALLANPLVLPAQPLVMTTGAVALIAGLLFPALGSFIGGLAWLPLAYTIRVVELFAQISWGSFDLGTVGKWLAGAVFVLFIVLALPIPRYKMPDLRRLYSPALLLVGTILLASLMWRESSTSPDGWLHATIFTLHPAPVVFVQTPAGARLLINVGEDADTLSSDLGTRLPIFDRRLDAVVITARNKSLFERLAVLSQRFTFGDVLKSAYLPVSDGLFGSLDASTQPQNVIQAGATLLTVDGVQLSVTADEKIGSALCLQYGSLRIYIPGAGILPAADCAAPTLVLLSSEDLEAQPPEQWQTLRAELVIYETDQVQEMPSNWMEQSAYRWVTVISDGSRMWIESKR
jgi:competence protein ComEC